MFILFSVLACTPEEDSGAIVEETNYAVLLEEQLTGNFDSSEQANSNPSYYSVSLRSCEVDAPEFGEHVLYVEQALSSDLSAPYRQRLYVIEQEGEDQVRSTIYSLVDEDSAIGLCDQNDIAVFTAQDITLREGCHVTLTWNGMGFEGQTEETSCESSLNGASYATSIVTTTPDVISSWDRGYDSQGEQVWGAVDGAYIFNRLTE